MTRHGLNPRPPDRERVNGSTSAWWSARSRRPGCSWPWPRPSSPSSRSGIRGAGSPAAHQASPPGLSQATGTGRAAAGTSHRLAGTYFRSFPRPHFTLLGRGERSAAALSHIETDLVKPYLVGPGGLLDDGGHVARAYGADALILIRPDGYIGLIADPEESGAVADYLRSL